MEVSNSSINQHRWTTTESRVIPWWFKDEGFSGATRTRTPTFQIATGTLDVQNESQKLNPGEPTNRVCVTVN